MVAAAEDESDGWDRLCAMVRIIATVLEYLEGDDDDGDTGMGDASTATGGQSASDVGSDPEGGPAEPGQQLAGVDGLHYGAQLGLPAGLDHQMGMRRARALAQRGVLLGRDGGPTTRVVRTLRKLRS